MELFIFLGLLAVAWAIRDLSISVDDFATTFDTRAYEFNSDFSDLVEDIADLRCDDE